MPGTSLQVLRPRSRPGPVPCARPRSRPGPVPCARPRSRPPLGFGVLSLTTPTDAFALGGGPPSAPPLRLGGFAFTSWARPVRPSAFTPAAWLRGPVTRPVPRSACHPRLLLTQSAGGPPHLPPLRLGGFAFTSWARSLRPSAFTPAARSLRRIHPPPLRRTIPIRTLAQGRATGRPVAATLGTKRKDPIPCARLSRSCLSDWPPERGDFPPERGDFPPERGRFFLPQDDFFQERGDLFPHGGLHELHTDDLLSGVFEGVTQVGGPAGRSRRPWRRAASAPHLFHYQ